LDLRGRKWWETRGNVLPDIIRMIKSRGMRWAEHMVCMGEMRNAYNILIQKPDEKRPLGRPRHR
jgi:hypothetical protein